MNAALITFAATILAALIAAIAGWITNKRDLRSKTRREEYSHFVSAVAGQASFQPGTTERQNYDRLSIEAKARIILHCSERVLGALARYQRSQTQEDLDQNFCKLIEEMRSDVGGGDVHNFTSLAEDIMIVRQTMPLTLQPAEEATQS